MMDQQLSQFMVDKSLSKYQNHVLNSRELLRDVKSSVEFMTHSPVSHKNGTLVNSESLSFIYRLGDPFGKELTIFNFEDIFRNGQGAIQAKYVRAFGEFKMPMGVEIMSVSYFNWFGSVENIDIQDEILVCNMNNGTVEFVDFEGGEALIIPTGEGGGPRSFKEPSVATVTLQHEDSKYSFLDIR